MAEEFWKNSAFGEESIFHPGWDERQNQLQNQQVGEIVSVRVENGDVYDKITRDRIIYDNLDPAKYRPPIYDVPVTQSYFTDITISISVLVKGNVESVTVAVNGQKKIASKLFTEYVAVFDLSIPLDPGKKEFEIVVQITNFIGDTVFDTEKLVVTLDTDGRVLESKTLEEEVSAGSWFVDHKTGEYKWFDDQTKRTGFTRVGHYKVTYDRDKNVISAYAGKDGVFVESIDMSTDTDGKYKVEAAAKFALIAAESGGSYVRSTDDPTIMPLVIGGCIENRLRLYDLGITRYATGSSVQDIKGFQADSYKSYKDFKYGNEKRFGLGKSAYEKRNMYVGLSTVYVAVIGSVRILNEHYTVPKGKVKEFEQMLYYAHGSGNTVNGDFDVAIPEGTSGKFQYVRGSNKYKATLKPK